MIRPIFKKVMHAVDEAENEIIDFLRELVRAPSLSGDEGAVAALIMDESANLDFRRRLKDPIGNVILQIEGDEEKELLFHTHLDHVPPGNMPDPYSAVIEDGRMFGIKGEVMYGRGICDAKSSICSMLMACKILLREGIRLDGNLTFAGVVMEESGGSLGTKVFLKDRSFDVAVVGEPTDLNISLGQRGGAFLYLKVEGISGHVGESEKCINAFEKSIDIIDCVKMKINRKLRRDRVLGKTVLSFTNAIIKPGFVSIIPGECLVQFDLRYTRKYSPDEIISKINDCIKVIQEEEPRVKAEVGYITGKSMKWGEYYEDIPPFYTLPQHPKVRVAYDIIKAVVGRPPQKILWPFATDGAFIAEKSGVTFGFGPGDYKLAHSVNERVEVRDVIAATKIYALLAVSLLRDSQAS